MYDEAKKEDWYSAYEEYIKKFPKGLFLYEATERLEWLKSHKAIAGADYPSDVFGIESPYSNLSSPFFPWKTTFYEKGGSIGYKVKGTGWVYDRNGDRWGPGGYQITREEITVKPGQKSMTDYWCADYLKCGYAYFIWEGEDAGGHPVRIVEHVNLKYSDCK